MRKFKVEMILEFQKDWTVEEVEDYIRNTFALKSTEELKVEEVPLEVSDGV